MGKDITKKIFNYEDAGASFANAGAVFSAAYAIDIGVNALLHFNPNKYNSIVHLTAGTIIGTYTYRRVKNIVYRKTGNNLRSNLIGLTAGLLAGGAISLGWEYVEDRGKIFQAGEVPIDTLLDHLAVEAGVVLSPLIEGIKKKIRK